MILLDSTEFKRILHIAKFFAMLGIYIETTKLFQKKEKNRDSSGQCGKVHL